MEYDVSLQTISWFNGLKENELLQISPKFQRRAVWLEKERAMLMDTILSQLPFPEIYIQVVTDPESGKQTHVVVDGQQRITSILKYIENEYPLPEIKGVRALKGNEVKKVTDYFPNNRNKRGR